MDAADDAGLRSRAPNRDETLGQEPAPDPPPESSADTSKPRKTYGRIPANSHSSCSRGHCLVGGR